MARTPDCHPERKHQARGLCDSCYQKDWHRAHPGRNALYGRAYRAQPDYRAKQTTYYQANVERIRAASKARYLSDPTVNERRIAAKYGLTLEQRRAILDSPCAICGGEATDIDHDHETGLIRGPLCGPCNTGIGHLRDDPDLVARASEYLYASRRLRAV